MPTVVVGGNGRNVGKTSLICGLIAALPECHWTAVKITSHDHGKPTSMWEETQAGQGTDTARYLAAGAQRAFLLTDRDDSLPALVKQLRAEVEAAAPLIFESNRIVECIHWDVFLAVQGFTESEPKPSFSRIADHADATVIRGDRDHMRDGEKPLFQLADLERISGEMREWLRARFKTRCAGR